MQRTIHGVLIEGTLGDIANQQGFDVVVNAANKDLKPGGGVAGAIHRAAGKALESETRLFAPIEVGQAVLTRGFNLPNPYVIHCLGPVYKVDEPSEKLLRECYEKALSLANTHGLKKLAFPIISSGAFGYPMHEAIEVALKSVIQSIESLDNITHIRFVVYNDSALEMFETLLKEREH